MKKRKKGKTFKKNAITEEDVLAAIYGSRGIIDDIRKKLNCSWYTAEKKVNKWESTKQAYKDELEIFLDECEMSIVKSVHKGDTQNAKWVLSRKGKHRGYGDAMQLGGNMVMNVKIEIKGE